ncbi:MAG TPA: MTAP family purine nucleoside phosphorylase [Acidimicrobiia bacterium]|nr:MTAP family purine nucleoside phosphorylase [Acidimicrobiia bacterium]
MARLAVVGGHSILGSSYAATDGVLVLQRHGDPYTPPHLIDHEANLRAVVAQGCDRVLALSSVGGLRAELGVGTFLAPDDFVSLHTSVSTLRDARGHIVPSLCSPWRDRVVAAWRARVDDVAPLRDGGVYWQSLGPRFETAAEIRLIAQHADVVGMTMASECIVAQELGLLYACVCIVDNLANGIGPRPLTFDEFEAGKAANREALFNALDGVIRDLL